MKTLLLAMLVVVIIAAVIFGVLCWLFPDWFDAWAGDEGDGEEPQ